MITLTEEQAYAAMFRFLDDFYNRTKSGDVASLLGSMSLLADGGPVDPAIAVEWREAVKFAIEGGKADKLEHAPLSN